MFKRANKITALVVAAASVMSVVPAMAATRLATKDGTIENAVAYKDGKYLYEGYRTDNDDKGIYFNSGDKDKKLDDVTEFDTAYGKYGKSQAAVQDGNDKYLVDLSTGKMTDDDTAEDLTTTAQAKLTTKLAKTDRYGKGIGELADITKIENNRFGEVWYEYFATTEAHAAVNSRETTSGAAGIVYGGYTNQTGTYIDASKDANIYAYNGDKMVKLECVGDTSDGLKLDSIKSIKTLGQDDKYIYRLISAHVTGAKKVSDSSSEETLYYVQKLSKAQGDKEKDAYLPKSTESFQLTITGNDDDAKTAYNVLVGTNGYDGGIVGNYSGMTYVSNGALYATYWKDGNQEKVKTTKIALKTSQKLRKGTTGHLQDTDKVDGHIAIKSSDKDTKADAWTVDVNGNVWALYDGEILESKDTASFTSLYTVDRSFDSIDVYDENSLIAWSEDKEGYTTVTEGKKAASDEATATVTPATVGWKQEGSAWTFYDATGTKVVNNWVNDKGTWYFIKADGTMATGWQQVGGTWYFLQSSGAMVTGWYNDNGTWYYLQSSGAMKTGWLNDNGTWYYLNASGAMAANTTVDGYTLSASGAML